MERLKESEKTLSRRKKNRKKKKKKRIYGDRCCSIKVAFNFFKIVIDRQSEKDFYRQEVREKTQLE